MRSTSSAIMRVVVAAVFARLETLFFKNERPSRELAVAFPVRTVSAFRMDDVSLNSHTSIVRSVGVFVLVTVKLETTSAKLFT